MSVEKLKVNKRELYTLLKKYGPNELPKMKDIRFWHSLGAFRLHWTLENKMGGVYFCEEPDGKLYLGIQVRDRMTPSIEYNKVIYLTRADVMEIIGKQTEQRVLV